MFWWSRKTLEIQGWRLRICKMFEIARAIYSNSERSEQFLKQNSFLTCSWSFFRSNICVTTFKLKKNIGKVKKCIFWQNSLYPDFIQIFEKTHSGYNLGLNQIKIEINIGIKLTWAGLFRGWRSLVSFTKHAQKNFIKHQRHWEHECYESVDERWTSQTNLVC